MIKYVILYDDSYSVHFEGKLKSTNRSYDASSKLPKTIRDFIVENANNCTVEDYPKGKLIKWDRR